MILIFNDLINNASKYQFISNKIHIYCYQKSLVLTITFYDYVFLFFQVKILTEKEHYS